MADFTSGFWNFYIIIPTVLGILACFWLVRWLSSMPADEIGKPTGHVWDEDLQELNNPLPRWWLMLFYLTLFFSIGYLALYPGLGTFKGMLGWTSTGQYEAEMAKSDSSYGPLFKKFADMDLVAVAADPEARRMGERMFVSYCSQCHGSDARGARGFPNLRDNDWLYGGDPQAIQTSIMKGRNGMMPPHEAMLGGEAGVSDMAEYVFTLAGRDADPEAAARGKEKFATICAACHGADGRGDQRLGAPNLTDNVWLYGGSKARVMETIAKGRGGMMPAHADFLGEEKVHLLAAYVYSLSTGQANEKE